MGRRRRPAEETKAEIIGVAQRHLFEKGPSALRLDEIAKDVGVSRQAILHYFGNRDGLLREVVQHAWKGLFIDLMSLVTENRGPEAFIDHFDEVIRHRGNARLGAWLLLSNQGLPDGVFENALASLPPKLAPDAEDADFRMLTVGAAMFGDAIFGGRLRQALGMSDSEEDRKRYQAWLADQMWGQQP